MSSPNQGHTELDANSTVRQAIEIGFEAQESSTLPVVPEEEQQAIELLIVTKEAPVVSSLQEPVKASRFKKHGVLFLTLFAVLITLFGVIGVGVSLRLDIIGQRSATITFPLSVLPSEQTVPSSDSISKAEPVINISSQYAGTLHDKSTGVTINISLSNIQQQQGNISGHLVGMSTNSIFNEIPQNSFFTGTISATRQIQFVLMSDAGRTAFSFNGAIQSDGTIVGTYCNLGGAARQCSDYGTWSVSPTT